MPKYRTSFSTNLKQLRTEAGISIHELSEAIGYTTKAIQNWEDGVSSPSFDAFSVLADYFNVSMDSLAGRTRNCKAAA